MYTLIYFQEQGVKKELKVVIHGSKLLEWVPWYPSPMIHGWLDDYDLFSLQRVHGIPGKNCHFICHFMKCRLPLLLLVLMSSCVFLTVKLFKKY